MTTLSKEDVVRWARESGCNIITTPDDVIARYNDIRVTNMLGCFAEAARADLVAENERLKKQLRQQAEAIASTINKHHTALAAAEEREEKLLEGISVICGPVMCAYTEGQRWEDYQELLTQPLDDSALRRLLAEAKAGVYEECAKVCENSDRYRGDYFAAKIRELAEKAKEEKC